MQKLDMQLVQMYTKLADTALNEIIYQMLPYFFKKLTPL